MKAKKAIDKGLMEMGEGAFWKEFEDLNPQIEQRYVIVKNGQVIVVNGKLKQGIRKIRV